MSVGSGVVVGFGVLVFVGMAVLVGGMGAGAQAAKSESRRMMGRSFFMGIASVLG